MKGSFAAPVRCIVTGCTRVVHTNPWAFPRTYAARYCVTHRSAVKRHGDPLQKSVDKRWLRKLIVYVKDVVKQDATGKLEAGLKQSHRNLHDAVLEVTGDFDAGRLVSKWTERGARCVLDVLEQVDPVECAAVVASLWLLRVTQSHRFASDRGFRFALVRLFRKQVRTSWGSYWDDKRQKVIGRYSELQQSTVESIAALLIGTYGRFASKMVTRFTAEQAQARSVKVAIEEGYQATIPRQPFAVCQSPPCTTLLPSPRYRKFCSRRCAKRRHQREWDQRRRAKLKLTPQSHAVSSPGRPRKPTGNTSLTIDTKEQHQ